MQYVYSLLAIGAGSLLVIKTNWFVETFGRSAWAEAKFGTNGGTRLLYKLIGLAIILIALLAMTGELGDIILGIIGSLFGVR